MVGNTQFHNYNEFLRLTKQNGSRNVALNKSLPIGAINFNNPYIGQPSQKKKKKGMIPSIIGAGITLTIASFLLTRGGGTKFATQMNKIMAKMDDKIYELSKNGSKTASFMEKSILACAKLTKRGAYGLSLLSNVTPIKDRLFDKILQSKVSKFLKLNKFADYAYNISEGLLTRTKVSKNAAALTSVDEVIGLIETQAKAKGISNETLKATLANLRKQSSETLGATGRLAREGNVKNSLNGIGDEINNELGMNSIWETITTSAGRKKLWQALTQRGYLSKDIASSRYSGIAGELTTQGRAITNELTQNQKEMSGVLSNLRAIISSDDTKSLDMVRELSKKISSLTDMSDDSLREINSLVSQLKFNPKFKPYIEQLEVTLNNKNRGLLQQLMTQTDELFGRENNGKIRKALENCSKKVNNAIQFENNSFFREAELKIGAATTDYGFEALMAIPAIAVPLMQDDNDKRVKKSLTLGIPVLGGLATCMYSSSLGFTGITGLAFGIISGKIIGILGKSAAKRYDKYRKDQISMQDVVNKYNMFNQQRFVAQG